MHCTRTFASLALAALCAAPAMGQALLLDEDFNSGIPGIWSKISLADASDTWTPGFGLVNGSGDINHEFFCHFGGVLRDHYIVSPAFSMVGVTNATLTFDQFHDEFNGISSANHFNRIEVSTNGGTVFTLLHDIPSSPEPEGLSSLSLNLDAFAGEANVKVAFHYRAVVGNDWSIDNVKVTSTWEDLGSAFPGVSGDPALTAEGPLTPLSPISVNLTNAAPTSTAYLVVGFSELNFFPFFGGTLVPNFELPNGTFFTLFTNGSGATPISTTWPAGIPAGFEVIMQYWVVDAGAAFGMSGSNAVKGTVP